MTWDVALPKDEPEMKFLCEGEKYRVYIYTDRRHGETYYQGQFQTRYRNTINSEWRMTGIWLDDSDCYTTDEDMALAWFNDNEYPLDEDE